MVFADGFEGFEDDAIATDRKGQTGMKWDVAWHTVRITREPANVHSGKQAAEIEHEQAPMTHGTGKGFEKGFDTLFVRYYMKLDKDFPGCHHTGMIMWAGAPGIIWLRHRPQRHGRAAQRTNHFVVAWTRPAFEAVQERSRGG